MEANETDYDIIILEDANGEEIHKVKVPAGTIERLEKIAVKNNVPVTELFLNEVLGNI